MSKIEWTNKTWNPIAGCSDVSEGCRNCYARTMAKRLAAMGQKKYEGLTVVQGSHTVWTGAIAFDERALLAPLRRRQPTLYFVNSMSDLFHENVTDEMRDRIFAVMALCPQHTFQVLTKRPERMREYLDALGVDGHDMAGSDGAMRWATEAGGFLSVNKRIDRLIAELICDAHEDTCLFDDTDPDGDEIDEFYCLKPMQWPLPNVWLGVSVEDQKTADARIPLLLQTPAAVRFLSCEPLLGAIDLTHVDWVEEMKRSYARYAEKAKDSEHEKMLSEMLASVTACQWEEGRAWRNVLTGAWFDGWDGDDSPEPDHPTIDWVIVGGESGPGARPMHPGWARSVRDQSVGAGVPFFFKQWGEWLPQTGGDDQLRSLPSTTPVTLLAADGHRGQSMFDMQGHARYGRMLRVGKKAAGDVLDGRRWQEMPEGYSLAGGGVGRAAEETTR